MRQRHGAREATAHKARTVFLRGLSGVPNPTKQHWTEASETKYGDTSRECEDRSGALECSGPRDSC